MAKLKVGKGTNKSKRKKKVVEEITLSSDSEASDSEHSDADSSNSDVMKLMPNRMAMLIVMEIRQKSKLTMTNRLKVKTKQMTLVNNKSLLNYQKKRLLMTTVLLLRLKTMQKLSMVIKNLHMKRKMRNVKSKFYQKMNMCHPGITLTYRI